MLQHDPNDALKTALAEVTDEYISVVDGLQEAYTAAVRAARGNSDELRRLRIAATETATMLKDMHEVEMAYQAAMVALAEMVTQYRARDYPEASRLSIDIVGGDRLVSISAATQKPAA